MASRVYRMQMRSHMVQIIGACGIPFSCAHTTPEPSPPLPNFNSVAIASSSAAGTLNAKYGDPPENSNVATGAAVGAGAGAVWGTLIGLACGPFAPACLPVTIPLMTATGVATGGVAGAVDDASTKPSKGQTKLLADIFLEISRQRIIHQEVGDAFERMIPPGRLVESAAADAPGYSLHQRMTFQSLAQLEMKQISMPAGDAKEYPNGNSGRLWWSRKINPGPKPGATVPPI